MREIKFRAWDGRNMRPWGFVQGCFLLTPPSESGGHQYPMMQFTGLTDKNGKEIYEGDVLLIPDEDVVPVTDEGQGPIEDCSHVVSVEFRRGEFGFEIPKSDDGETGWFTWRTWDEITDPDEIEIIGNIYENPELLINK